MSSHLPPYPYCTVHPKPLCKRSHGVPRQSPPDPPSRPASPPPRPPSAPDCAPVIAAPRRRRIRSVLKKMGTRLSAPLRDVTHCFTGHRSVIWCAADLSSPDTSSVASRCPCESLEYSLEFTRSLLENNQLFRGIRVEGGDE